MFLSVPPKEEKALAPEELDRASVLERFLKTEKKEPQEAKFIDKQLERAIEYLTDVLTYKAAREGAAPPVAQAP